MKLLRTSLLALAVLALLVPVSGLGGQMPLPLEKKVNAGTSTLTYAGQSFRFTTPVSLLVRCTPESETAFEMSVVLYPGTTPPSGPSGSSANNLTIFWTNFGNEVYNGGVPVTNPWTGGFTSEGGFVDR